MWNYSIFSLVKAIKLTNGWSKANELFAKLFASYLNVCFLIAKRYFDSYTR